MFTLTWCPIPVSKQTRQKIKNTEVNVSLVYYVVNIRQIEQEQYSKMGENKLQ